MRSRSSITSSAGWERGSWELWIRPKRASTLKLRPTEPEPQQALPFEANVVSDAPLCAECGSLMTQKRFLLQV